jgi:hypothetical protein
MNTELTTATAERINELHKTVLQSVQTTTEAVNRAMMASVEIGGHLREIPKGVRMAWLRDNCPGITHKQIAAYLSIEATYRRRPDNAVDHRFFALLGLTDSEDPTTPHTEPAKSAAPQWMTWTGKLVGHFTTMIEKTPPSQWDEQQRLAVAEQMKPIVELYEQITRSHTTNR